MNKPQNDALSGTYGHISSFDDKTSYEQVRNGINQGQNPIKLWREFKSVKMEEMAAILELPSNKYYPFENGIAPSVNHLKGICWYLDIHPTDLVNDNILDINPSYVAALCHAHNHPDSWPLNSQSMRDTTRELLQDIASPQLSVAELSALYDKQANNVGYSGPKLRTILETAIVNDGNTIFYRQGGLKTFVLDEIKNAINSVKDQKEFLQAHDRSFTKKADDLARKGFGIYRDNWQVLKPMVDELYVPGDTSVIFNFLTEEIKRPKRLNPVTDRDYKDLVAAHDTHRHAETVEREKNKRIAKLSLTEMLQSTLSEFNKSNKCFINTYDNRQLILSQAPDIAQAIGDRAHRLYKNHAMASSKRRGLKPAL